MYYLFILIISDRIALKMSDCISHELLRTRMRKGPLQLTSRGCWESSMHVGGICVGGE